MNKEQLTKKAESLGIDVDGRWSNERIQEAIDAKEAEGTAATGTNAPTGTGAGNEATPPSGDIVNEKTPKQPNNPDAPPQVIGQTPGETPRPLFAAPEPAKGEKKIKVVLDSDYWPEEGERRKAGEALSIPASKAKELIQTGKAHIPMPEDER